MSRSSEWNAAIRGKTIHVGAFGRKLRIRHGQPLSATVYAWPAVSASGSPRQTHNETISLGRDLFWPVLAVPDMLIDYAQLGAFLAALFALVGSPGPATLGLAAAGVAFGFRAARAFLVGSLCGAALTISLVGTGVVGALLAHPGVAPVIVGLAVAYMLYLAYRIAMAPPLGEQALKGRPPGFLAGFLLGITNPKGYAVFATLFSGFVVIPDDVTTDALLKGVALFGLLTAIDLSWLFAGAALRHLFHDPGVSRRINIGFAVLLLVSVALAIGL